MQKVQVLQFSILTLQNRDYQLNYYIKKRKDEFGRLFILVGYDLLFVIPVLNSLLAAR